VTWTTATSEIPHLTPALSAPRGGEGASVGRMSGSVIRRLVRSACVADYAVAHPPYNYNSIHRGHGHSIAKGTDLTA